MRIQFVHMLNSLYANAEQCKTNKTKFVIIQQDDNELVMLLGLVEIHVYLLAPCFPERDDFFSTLWRLRDGNSYSAYTAHQESLAREARVIGAGEILVIRAPSKIQFELGPIKEVRVNDWFSYGFGIRTPHELEGRIEALITTQLIEQLNGEYMEKYYASRGT